MSEAFVLLEDGARFDGEACGAAGQVTGEVVFTTSMSGYQEAVTDPSFAGQILTFTAPHVGNYGVSAAAMESDRIHARGAIMRAAMDGEDAPGAEGWLTWLADAGVPAIGGVDTRALVRHLRDRGAMRGGIFAGVGEEEAARSVAAEPSMAGADLAATVSPPAPVELAPLAEGGPGAGLSIGVIDTGVKTSIIRNLRERGARVTLLPCAHADFAAYDLVFLANGPGDPAALEYIVQNVRAVVGQKPVFGICLGHQLLCRAVGLQTYKLPFGHRGSNHPVRDLGTGHVEITSQNHGFAVLGPGGEHRIEADEPVRWETGFGAAELTHVNLYDRTVEGLVLREASAGTLQYHPEAGPGPHDSLHFFDDLLTGLA